MKLRALHLLPALVLPIVLSACPRDKKEDALTFAEAKQAVEEATLASQAESLTSASVEITTDFTIGQAVEKAAEEIGNFVVSQLPCAEITLSAGNVTVNYGAKPGNCTYKGHTFSGTHSITVKSADGVIDVHHEWMSFTNGVVTLNGTADVTWDFNAKSRDVVHTATWTRVSDGYTVTGSGNRKQIPLSGGVLEGIQVDGSRSWTTPRGNWDLAIDGVQMRWIDPVPQAGSYTLSTPFDKSLSLSFDRVDDLTIKVTVSGGGKSFSFNVKKAGTVDAA